MHAPRKDFKDLLRVHAAPGEPFVWLTSMGLGIGLLMVAGLLGVIVMNGLPVFWPGRAVTVKLKEGRRQSSAEQSRNCRRNRPGENEIGEGARGRRRTRR